MRVHPVINTIRPWRWASRTRDTKENDIEKKLYNVCVCVSVMVVRTKGE